jgi:purine-binding chemotaxis protein CheW
MSTQQVTTFSIDRELFGIEVQNVQEVTGDLNIVSVPLAPTFIKGLVNLRGQIATAINLKKLFSGSDDVENLPMSVVCKLEGNLLSLMVDSIGDVLEVHSENFEEVPDTVALNLRKYIKGVYKLETEFLSILDIEAIMQELSPTTDTNMTKL